MMEAAGWPNVRRGSARRSEATIHCVEHAEPSSTNRSEADRGASSAFPRRNARRVASELSAKSKKEIRICLHGAEGLLDSSGAFARPVSARRCMTLEIRELEA